MASVCRFQPRLARTGFAATRRPRRTPILTGAALTFRSLPPSQLRAHGKRWLGHTAKLSPRGGSSTRHRRRALCRSSSQSMASERARSKPIARMLTQARAFQARERAMGSALRSPLLPEPIGSVVTLRLSQIPTSTGAAHMSRLLHRSLEHGSS